MQAHSVADEGDRNRFVQSDWSRNIFGRHLGPAASPGCKNGTNDGSQFALGEQHCGPEQRRLTRSMSGLYRHVGKAHQLIGRHGPASHQQKRFIGDLPVKPNKYIEAWGTYRENVEYTFKS